MPTKTARRDNNPGSVMSWTQIDPSLGTRSKEGEAMLHCFREEEEKTRGARKNLFLYESRFCLLMILMDSQVSKSMF